MRFNVPRCLITCVTLLLVVPVYGANDDLELTRSIQQDLRSLGYDVDNVVGELTMQTRIAIGAAEEKYLLPLTGKPSFALAAKTKADVHAQKKVNNQEQVSAGPDSVKDSVNANPVVVQTNPVDIVEPAAPAVPDAACLQDKVDANSAKRKGNSIAAAGARILRRFGNQDVVETIDEVSRTAADVVATSDDVSAIADELDLTEDQVRSCI